MVVTFVHKQTSDIVHSRPYLCAKDYVSHLLVQQLQFIFCLIQLHFDVIYSINYHDFVALLFIDN